MDLEHQKPLAASFEAEGSWLVLLMAISLLRACTEVNTTCSAHLAGVDLHQDVLP